MPTITCFEQNQQPITDSAIWDSISTLSHHVPDELIIITANNNYRESLLHLLIHREKCNYFPCIQSFDDWVNQLLNIEPYSYFNCYHQLLQIIEINYKKNEHTFLLQEDMLKSLLNFFIFLLMHDYSFDDSKHLFPDFLNDIETDCKELFSHFKQTIKDQPSFYSIMDKCRLIQEKKQLLSNTLQQKTVVFIGFTAFTKTHRYILQRLLPLITQSTFYTPKDSHIQRWLMEEFNNVLCIPQPISNNNNVISSFEFETLDAECRWVIKDSLSKLENDQQRIQIVVPNDRHYNKKLHDIAREFNLALQSSKRLSFQHTSFFETLKNILNFIQYPNQVSALECLFSSPLISRFNHENSLYDIDLELLLQIFRKEGVTSGFDHMKQAFDYTLEALSKKINYQHDDEQSIRLKDRISEQWIILESLYNYIVEFKKSRTLTDWIECLLNLFELFEIHQQIEFLATQENIINQQAFDSFIQQLPLFKGHIENDFKPNSVMIGSRMMLFFEQLTIDFSPENNLPIYVHSLQEAAFFPADYTYILAFHDACWPYAISENIFLQQVTTTAFIDIFDDDKDYQFLLLSQLCHQLCCFTSSKDYLGKQTEPSRFQFKLPFNIDIKTPKDFSLLVSKTEYLQQRTELLTENNIDLIYLKSKLFLIQTSTSSIISNKRLLVDLSEKINKTPFSATRLDTYQRCPTQFYYRYILGLEPADELSEGISAAQWGVLVHDMMYIFNKKGQYNNKLKLKEAAEEAFRKIPYLTFYWEQKKELLFGTYTQTGLIDAIFDVIQNQTYRLHPGQFEMAFNWTLKQSNYTFKGKIDALFYTDLNEPVIIDYKTSRQLSSSVDFEEYRSLQLPIYGLSIYKQYGKIPVGSLLFQINSPSHTDMKVIACTQDAKKDTFELKRKRPYIYEESYFQALEQHLHGLISLIETGFISTDYHPLLAKTYSKRAQSCRVCPYSLHCQFKERFNAVY